MIQGFPLYQVSNFGRVINIKTMRILKPVQHSPAKKYLAVNLYRNGELSPKRLIHQLVAREWLENPEGKYCIDHIDGDVLNNCVTNLRFATLTENQMNRKKQSTISSSRFKGVHFSNAAKKWIAKINLVNGKQTYLGLFSSEEDAARKYNEFAKEHFGSFAKLIEID